MESLHPRIRFLWIAQGVIMAVVLGVALAAADQFFVDIPTAAIGGLAAG